MTAEIVRTFLSRNLESKAVAVTNLVKAVLQIRSAGMLFVLANASLSAEELQSVLKDETATVGRHVRFVLESQRQ